MNEELNQMLNNLSDAGCGQEELEHAAQLYETGDAEALLRHFRKCRSRRMDELHEVQRKVDRLDFLIRQRTKGHTINTR